MRLVSVSLLSEVHDFLFDVFGHSDFVVSFPFVGI